MNKSSRDFFKNEDDRNDFLISIPVITFAAVFILWQWNTTPSEVTSEQTETLLIEEVQSVERKNNNAASIFTTSDIPPESNDLNISPTIFTTSPRVKTDTGATFNSFPAILADSNPEEINPVDTLLMDSAVPSPDLFLDTASMAPQAINTESKELPITTEETIEPESITTSEEKLDCTIAIGLYRIDDNLHKMYNRLIQNDFAAIRVPLKYSTKVAIKIPCNKESAHRILKEIRANYAQDAYIE